MTKNCQKWPKIWVFGLFRKIDSLVLSGNGVEWKYLWPFSIPWKPHMWKKSDSQGMSKNAFGFQISVFFNRQHLVNRLTYDSEHVIDMNERDKVWEWVFWKKNVFRGKWVILGLKMARPYNFGYAPRIFLKFCTMKGAKRYIHGTYINSFLEKILIWGKCAILVWKWHVITLDPL